MEQIHMTNSVTKLTGRQSACFLVKYGLKKAVRPINCDLYAYAANNPLRYIDPTGNNITDVPDDTQQSAGREPDSPKLGNSKILIYDQGCTFMTFYRMAKALGYTGTISEANQVALKNDLFDFCADDNANTLLSPKNGAALVTALCGKDGYVVMYDSSVSGTATDMAKAINKKENTRTKSYFTTARLKSGHSVSINRRAVIANNITDISDALAFKYNDTSVRRRRDSKVDSPARVDFFVIYQDNWARRK